LHPFTDAAGRRWEVNVHVASVRRVRALLNLDLYSLASDNLKPLSKLLADPCQLCDVLFVLCEPQAEKLGVTDEDFGRGMAGDALARGVDAFLAEVCDFFPNARTREAIRAAVDAGRLVADAVAGARADLAARMDPPAVAAALIASLTSSPGLSASTPDPSPSAPS
jgi:hypothetical protein